MHVESQLAVALDSQSQTNKQNKLNCSFYSYPNAAKGRFFFCFYFEDTTIVLPLACRGSGGPAIRPSLLPDDTRTDALLSGLRHLAADVATYSKAQHAQLSLLSHESGWTFLSEQMRS